MIRLQCPRFRLRWMMITIAVVGLVLGMDRAGKRRTHYQQLAEEARQELSKSIESDLRLREGEASQLLEVDTDSSHRKIWIARHAESLSSRVKYIAYYTQLSDHYEWVAYHPWLPVPCEPESPNPISDRILKKVKADMAAHPERYREDCCIKSISQNSL